MRSRCGRRAERLPPGFPPLRLLRFATIKEPSWPLSPCPNSGRSAGASTRSEEHTSELQSLMRISYAVFCLKKKKTQNNTQSQYSSSFDHTPPKKYRDAQL